MPWTYLPSGAAGSLLIATEAVIDDQDKTLTVSTTAPELDNDIPRGIWRMLWLRIKYVSGAGLDRDVRMSLKDAAGNVIYLQVLDQLIGPSNTQDIYVAPRFTTADFGTVVNMGSGGLAKGCANLHIGPGMALRVWEDDGVLGTDNMILNLALLRIGRGGA